MSLISTVRTMDKRLRLALLSTALLIVVQIGQLITIAQINADGKEGGLAIFFAAAGIFFIPTAVILTGAVMYALRHERRQHQPLFLLGALNLLMSISLTWFFIHPCSWSNAIGIALTSCR